MTVTIKDIAKELNISYSSVSRALNNKSGVSQDKTKEIKKLARKMGYQPNNLARGLVSKTSKTIGVVIPDINNPFFGEIVTGVTELAKEKGYNILLCVSDWNADQEKEEIDSLIERRVDGIIIKPSNDQKQDAYKNIDLPLVILENWSLSKNRIVVEVDNKLGGYIATKYLLECGYKKIGFLGGRTVSHSSGQRISGWKKALKEAEIPFEEDMIAYGGAFTVQGGYLAAENLFQNVPDIDAIFASNDVIALGALQCLSEKNIKVPEEIGVVGFDNIVYAELPQIRLTTIHQPKYELGQLAASTIIGQIEDAEGSKTKNKTSQKIVLEPKLVVRKTTRDKEI